MKYGMLLWPHANSRYQEAVKPLAARELQLLAGCEGVYTRIAGCDWLVFDTDNLSDIAMHAHMYLVCELHPDGLMKPVLSPAPAYLGGDLGGILKYKGKTNEVFTRFMLNIAVASSAFRAEQRRPLRFLDPLCGRGTALFEAVNRGWNATGIDIDRADLTEASRFFKRYLEYHRIKHASAEQSRTVPGGGAIRVETLRFAPTADAYRSGDTRDISFIAADAAGALKALKEASFHVCCADLPYGVQHAPGNNKPFDALLQSVLPGIFRALLPGGAVALSFNVNTLKRDAVLDHLARSGFIPMRSAAYEGMEHWVEQAVTRDVCVGVRPV